MAEDDADDPVEGAEDEDGSPIAFFRVNGDGEHIPAEAPEGNQGGAEYFDGRDYNYTMGFSSLNAPMGSVYVNRPPRLLPTGWVPRK